MHRSGPCHHCPCTGYVDNGATKRLLDQLVPYHRTEKETL